MNTTVTIVEIPLDQLRESPFNPRKTFTDIDQLAQDIRTIGRVLQPLLVRPHFENVLRPDGPVDHYEVVFGHRRLRAATAAGLATVPCMVREMGAEETKRAQISENLSRKDVHPIEEAEGFQVLMKDHGVTADQLAEQTGKSKSYVYGRLKLLHAVPEIREACVNGEISSEVALLIARLRTEKFQSKALQYIRSAYIDMKDGGKSSFRRVKELLNEKFTLDLAEAIFDPADATLCPLAGSCTDCPKRSGNAPEFEDVATADPEKTWHTQNAGADVCTDPDCFAEKKKVHLRCQAARLQAEGKTVIEGNKARAAIGADGTVKGAYVALTDVQGLLKKGKGKNKDATAPAFETVLIQDPRGGKVVEAVAVASLKAAGIQTPEPKKKSSGYDWEEENRKRQAERERCEALAANELPQRLNLLKSVRAAMAATERSAFDLRLVVRVAYEGVQHWARGVLLHLWQCADEDALLDHVQAMPPQDLTRFLLDCALVEHVNVPASWIEDADREPGPLLAAAKHYGVDIDAARAGQLLLVEEPTGEASELDAPAAAEEHIEHTPEELAELQAQGWVTVDNEAEAHDDTAEPDGTLQPRLPDDLDQVTRSAAVGILSRLQAGPVDGTQLHKHTVLLLLQAGLARLANGAQASSTVELTDAGRDWLTGPQAKAWALAAAHASPTPGCDMDPAGIARVLRTIEAAPVPLAQIDMATALLLNREGLADLPSLPDEQDPTQDVQRVQITPAGRAWLARHAEKEAEAAA